MNGFRLTAGGRVSRERALRFTFDGRAFTGYQGDTLASALLANGVDLLGRSFKYHRPRGLLAAGVEEPNALIELDRGPGRREPNLPATTIELFDGLVARSQNRFPSLEHDLGALTGLAAPALSAGFYYKTFMWPRGAWQRFYEPAIRAMAGLGRAPELSDPDRYAFRYAHCDVLIVGGGQAGLRAALEASAAGKDVILCDEQAEFGGDLLSSPDEVVDGAVAWRWLERTLEALSARGNIRLLPRTTAFLYGAQNMVGLAERLGDHLARHGGARQRQWQVRATEVVLATGAHERPLVFGDNDLPGVMLASAARTYLNRYGVAVGRRVAVCIGDDSGYQAALDLAKAGIKVTTIDSALEMSAALQDALKGSGVTRLMGCAPVKAVGRRRVKGLRVGRIGHDQQSLLDCDAVLMAGGWTPAVHLFSQSRGKLAWREDLGAYGPAEPAQAVRCVGACAGDLPDQQANRPAAYDAAAAKRFAFVDFQNDVTAKDIQLAVREGFRSVEHIKRYTTTGMATDQGRTSNINAMAVAGEALGVKPGQVGVTSYRAPYTPTSFGTWAGYARGALFDPVRKTPIHAWAAEHGAVFEDVGLWKRARYFPKDGEDMQAAVARECRITRQVAGLFDASTLGKIEVVGPDAAEFMNWLYTNPWLKLEAGRCRYGLMLREDGFIFDDGVVGRMAPDRFHVTTTTGGAARVLNHMEDYLQTEFPDLRVWLTSTTEQWAVIALNGPKAREILQPFVEGIDLSAEAFPHMAVREGRICGVETRLFRVSFTGELGFEVNVPPSAARQVWETLHARAEGFGATVYGTETMHVLRAEKGYIIIGQETDGTVTPFDAGLDWAVGKAKRDFVGKRSLLRPEATDPERKHLVGLLSQDGRSLLEEGAQVTPTATSGPNSALGHVTSAYRSQALGQPIALALVSGGRARLGQTLWVTAGAGAARTAVQVVEPIFYDPKGERLDG